MDELNAHPDDETLFDLIEGALDETRAREIERHLDTCSHCGATVRAALAGSPDHVTPVEALPAAEAQILQLRLADAWRSRTASIAAIEALEDAAEPPIESPEPEQLEKPQSRWKRARAGRGRRFVPVLSFCVLAILAVTSISLDDRFRGAAPSTESSGIERTTTSEVPDVQGGAATALDAATPTSPTAKEFEGSVEPTSGERSAQQPEEELCIATLDTTQLVLPDGRIPRRIFSGPMGMFVVCG